MRGHSGGCVGASIKIVGLRLRVGMQLLFSRIAAREQSCLCFGNRGLLSGSILPGGRQEVS